MQGMLDCFSDKKQLVMYIVFGLPFIVLGLIRSYIIGLHALYFGAFGVLWQSSGLFMCCICPISICSRQYEVDCCSFQLEAPGLGALLAINTEWNSSNLCIFVCFMPSNVIA